jgi:hypothetical protein
MGCIFHFISLLWKYHISQNIYLWSLYTCVVLLPETDWVSGNQNATNFNSYYVTPPPQVNSFVSSNTVQDSLPSFHTVHGSAPVTKLTATYITLFFNPTSTELHWPLLSSSCKALAKVREYLLGISIFCQQSSFSKYFQANILLSYLSVTIGERSFSQQWKQIFSHSLLTLCSSYLTF